MERVCQKGMNWLDLDLTVLKSILNFTNISHTFLMSTNDQNDFSIMVEGYVNNMLYFNSRIRF